MEIKLKHHIVFIDDDDYELVKDFSWYVCGKYSNGTPTGPAGVMAYAKQDQYCNTKSRMILMHRLILGFPPSIIDHIDGNPLNNCKSNLRPCLPMQNSWNQKLSINNKSGAKGVYWNKKKRVWTTQIMANGRRFFLGHYPTVEKARNAYKEAADIHHGVFARLK